MELTPKQIETVAGICGFVAACFRYQALDSNLGFLLSLGIFILTSIFGTVVCLVLMLLYDREIKGEDAGLFSRVPRWVYLWVILPIIAVLSFGF